jgi:hypothetical protein
MLVYYLGGCTGILQPWDVGLQRVFKHYVKTAAMEYLSDEVERMVCAGLPLKKICLGITFDTLRDETPGWLLFAYEHVFQNNGLIKKAWARCKVGEWDLSYENLTSTAALDCLDTFFRFFEQGGLVMAQRN